MAKLIKYTTLSFFLILAVALVSAGLLLPAADVAYASPHEVEGSGTSNDPFKIYNEDQWSAVVTYANTADTGGKYFHLMNDLDMNGRSLTPIGISGKPFQGKLYGNGKVISNVNIQTTGGYAGLFGLVGAGGEIRDLGVFGGEIVGTNLAGGIAAQNNGLIVRSFSTANVFSSGSGAGGIVGENSGLIKNCYSTGNIVSNSGFAGGIAGYLSSPSGDAVSFSYSLGKVQSAGSAGGVIGGRSANLPVVKYSYFNKTANPSLYGIGSGLASPGDNGGNITTGNNRVEGLEQNNFNNLIALRFTDAGAENAWKLSYSVTNFSAYFAPNLAAFQPINPPAAPVNNYSYNSVIIRRYGIKENGAGEWGTATNPYVISTPAHMVNLSIAVNQNNTTYSDSFFYVNSDIDFSGINFNPIGALSGTPFSGSFDGGNFTFSNLKIDGDNSADNVALFGYTDGKATVQNLRFSETCSFAGRKNIATVSAYNRGKIINIESRSAVRGTSNVGGIVGENHGSLTDILSAVVFTKNPGAQVYGVIGASVNSVLKNVWFFTRYNAECTEVGGAGSMLIVDKNGDVAAQKTQDGKISFSQLGTPAMGYRVNYRTENQVAVGQNNIYAPDPNSAQLTVYARFVREITAIEPAAGNIKLLNAVTNNPVTEGLYYEGQTGAAVITVNASHFLKNAQGSNIFGQTMGNIKDLVYSYDFNASVGGFTVINLSFTVSDNLRELRAEIESIDATSIARRYYDGTPTVYTYTKPGLGAEYIFEYSYGTGGQSPVNASLSAYNLGVIVKRDGVVRGAQNIEFYIEPRPLEIPEASLSKIKEYDGKVAGAYVPVAVDQSIIAGHTHSILGENIVTMDIVQGGTHRVVVKATADFGGAAIGDNRIVNYKFELEGFSAGNYSVPDFASYGGGQITKRTVVYHIEEEKDEGDGSLNRRLTRVFDGTMAAVSHYGVVFGKGGVSGVPVLPSIGFAIDDGNGVLIPDSAINAGEYTVTISTGNPEFYNVIFDKEYKFIVTPKPVAVTFTGTTLTYNTEIQTIGGFYYDIDSIKRELSADYFSYTYASSPESGAVELINAELYIAQVTLRDNYAAIDTQAPNGLKANQTYVTVNKAQQDSLSIVPLPGNHKYGDQPKQLSATGGSGDGLISFSVAEGFAVTDGDMLVLTGGGIIKIIAVKGESQNYLSASAEYEILVAKETLNISLENINSYYGDKQSFDYIFSGFVAGDAGVPRGFTLPSVLIDGEPYDDGAFYPVKLSEEGEVIGYTLTIGEDATSDGYEFDYSYFSSNTVYLIVNKKVIIVRAEYSYSVYGDEHDAPLTFSVYETDGEGDENKLSPDEYSLVIELMRHEGRNAGLYTIACGLGSAEENALALALANPDYQITFYEGSYEIRPKTLSLVLNGMYEDESTGVKFNKKTFGEADPELIIDKDYTVSGLAPWDTVADALSGKGGVSISQGLLRTVGENAYSSLFPDLLYGFYSYLPTGLEISPNYTLSFSGINLRIYPAEPVFGEQEDILLQYGDSLSSVPAASKVSVNASGALVWAMPELVPDFTESPILTFDAVFTSGDRNYKNAVISLTVGVIPREITITFGGNTELIYNGKEQKQITYTVNNALPGDEFTEPLVYLIENEPVQSVKNAGEYRARLVIENANYKIVGASEIVFVIAKAPLLIYLEDISLPETVTPTKNFIYEGFVNGENAGVLTTLPDVVFNTAAGNYEIVPSGAASPNYQITYRPSMQYVTKTLLTSTVASFVLEGNFNSLTEYTLEEIRKAENRIRYTAIEEGYALFKSQNPAFSKMKTAMVFAQNFTVDGEKVELSSAARATLELPTRLRESKEFGVILIKADGSIVEAKNVVREGNKLSFDMEDCDYFAITAPPDYTWIILLAVVTILFISVFVLDMVSERLGIGRHSSKNKAKRQNKRQQQSA